MTHEVDCSIMAAFEDEIDEAAAAIYDRNDWSPVGQLADEHGWEEIGHGWGRTTYRVTDPGEPGITGDGPCVMKFATPGHGLRDGRMQNFEEISQYQRFPANLTGDDGGVPAVVPLRDWDRDRQLWISAPMVDPSGGGEFEVKDRLKEKGWRCTDVSRDNIGEMHGESVLLDYGTECHELDLRDMMAGSMMDFLSGRVDNITGELEHDDSHVYFVIPGDLPGNAGPPPKESHAVIREIPSDMAGVYRIDLVLGSWYADRDYFPTVEDGAEDLREAFEHEFEEDDLMMTFVPNHFGDLLALELRIEADGWNRFGPLTAEDAIGWVLDRADVYLPDEPVRSPSQARLDEVLADEMSTPSTTSD